MKCVRAVVFVLVFFTPAVARAVPLLPGAPDTVPLLFACANNVCLPVTVPRIPGEKETFGVFELPIFFPGLGQAEVTATYNPDPFIEFSATSINLTPGPVTWTFLYGTPVVEGLYSVATSTGTVSVINGVSGTTTVDNSAVHPTYISGYGSVGSPAINANVGVDIGTAPCVAGPPFPETTICNQGTSTNTFAPTVYDNLEVLLTYSQSGTLSSATWSGTVTLEERRVVPEPTLLGLFGLAAIAFGARRRRK